MISIVLWPQQGGLSNLTDATVVTVSVDTRYCKQNFPMAAPDKKEKEPTNIVHQNAIFCETVHKEQRHQKLYTNYGVNPYKKSKTGPNLKYIICFF